MTKKRRFNISRELSQGISETINAVTDNVGQVRFEVISLDRVEVDPENPRELSLTLTDIENIAAGKSLPAGANKQEYESLQQLADTISKKGLINPVVVYKLGEKYRLVAGERRFLASHIAGKRNVQARILNEKPKNVDLRLLQWIENTEREDLSLKDRIGNLKTIIQEFKKENSSIEITASVIKELIGISLAYATYYLSVLNAADDIHEHIESGKLNNLDKAAVIAKVTSEAIRKKALEACLNGASLKQIKNLIDSEQKAQTDLQKKTPKVKQRGRVAQRVNLGATHKPAIVKKLIYFVLNQPEYSAYKERFKNIDWQEYGQATKAFKQLIDLLEKDSD